MALELPCGISQTPISSRTSDIPLFVGLLFGQVPRLRMLCLDLPSPVRVQDQE